MRFALAIGLLLFAKLAWGQEWEDQRDFNADPAHTLLRILSSTDTELFASLINSFVSDNPDISIEYLVTGTADIDKRFRRRPHDFDIVISSAMDLQLKLANDGFALPLPNILHPEWAEWRKSLFAFTSEPATIVVNRAAFEGLPIPESRQDLIEALRERPDLFRGRVGTYDIRQSGLGYLFATQDSRASETFWRLMEVMGALEVRLYCCSGDMIDDLTDGTIAVAYNVLGSYATARIESQESLEIILPSDFPTTMMRTALVSRDTRHSDAAEAFVRHLVAQQTNGLQDIASLPPLSAPEAAGARATISLEPALMTFLDRLKREKFLSEWEDAMIQN